MVERKFGPKSRLGTPLKIFSHLGSCLHPEYYHSCESFYFQNFKVSIEPQDCESLLTIATRLDKFIECCANTIYRLLLYKYNLTQCQVCTELKGEQVNGYTRQQKMWWNSFTSFIPRLKSQVHFMCAKSVRLHLGMLHLLPHWRICHMIDM